MNPRESRSAARPTAASVAMLAELGERGDEDACLDYLRTLRFPDGDACPRCGRATRFHRVRGRSAYACQYCRHQVYPTAQTVFHRSTTPLPSWFDAIALVDGRDGASTAAELAGSLGVSRKTAARMLALIQPLTRGGDEVLLTSPPAQPRSPNPGGAPTRASLARDPLREELFASIAGLRKELEAAELRERAANAEVDALRRAIIHLERLVGTGAAS